MDRLPFVSEAVGAAVQEELKTSEGNDYVIKILERLQDENPCLANFITHYALHYDDPAAVTTGALLTYRLLESQLEADTMRRDFPLEEDA
ncbi:MAG: hypothetical protein CL910_04160 [Deltaproteobacteria bacterium]|nr:hypothetical protein [Deltaproteobacteria bacterium]